MSTIVRSLSALAIVPVVASTATTEPPSMADADESPGLAEMVAMVPATSFELGSPAQLYFVDMSLAWERIGAGADPAERAEHVGELPVVETFSMGPQLFGQYGAMFDEARAEIGFSMVEIERELALFSPPNDLFIDVTSVSADVITDALEADVTWSPDLTTVETDHGPYFSWGDGTEPNPERMSPLHPLGRGGQLAVLGDSSATTIRTFDSAQMEAVLETSAGETQSATTSVVLGPVLDVLAAEAVYELVAIPSPPLLDPALLVVDPDAFEALLESDQLALPYLGTVVAEIGTPDATSTEIFLVHLDAESAEANAERVAGALESGVDVATMQPLADVLPDAEVSVEGALVRVSVPGPGTFNTALRMISARSLFPTG